MIQNIIKKKSQLIANFTKNFKITVSTNQDAIEKQLQLKSGVTGDENTPLNPQHKTKTTMLKLYYRNYFFHYSNHFLHHYKQYQCLSA